MKKRVLLLVLAVLALTFVLVSCGHEHNFQQSEVITEPTCDSVGTAKFVCECGEAEEREIAAKGHTFGEALVVEPTCWTDGYTYQVCTVCEAESEHTDKKPASSEYHKFDQEKITKQPDCKNGKDGEKKTVCSVCGAENPKGRTELIKWAHDMEETRVDATCQAPGSVKETCKTCGFSKIKEELEQLDHTAVLVENVVATCEKGAYASYKCSVCQDTWEIIDEANGPTGHTWSTEQKQNNPTCTIPGNYYEECSACGSQRTVGELIPALNHDVDYDDAEFTTVVNATCITNGSITPTCKRCNLLLDTELDAQRQSYVQTIPATGVHFVTKEEGESFVATCHRNAYTEYKCTVDANCVEIQEIEEANTKLAHSRNELGNPNYTQAAKCNEDGFDFYYCTLCVAEDTTKCDICVQKVLLDRPDHDTEGGTHGRIEATCITNSYEEFICSMCKEEWTKTYTTDEYPLRDHGDWEPMTDGTVAPTCSAEGYTVYMCTRDDKCVKTDNQAFTRRSAHVFTPYIDGRLVCNVCNVTYRDVTTYINEAIDSGDLVIDEDTLLYWELKGYKAPLDPYTLAANGDQFTFTYVSGAEDDKATEGVNESTLDISKGLIILEGTENTTYTITVTYDDGKTVTYPAVDSRVTELSGAKVVFDLYETDKITSVTVTASTAATVVFYAYEG